MNKEEVSNCPQVVPGTVTIKRYYYFSTGVAIANARRNTINVCSERVISRPNSYIKQMYSTHTNHTLFTKVFIIA